MLILYTIGIKFYYFLVLIASIWNPKAAKWIAGRRNWRDKLKGVFAAGDKVIWFHCASLGEFEQGRPLIEKLRTDFPEKKILLTFFSPSGYEKRKNYSEADYVCYLPLDTRRNAREFMAMVPLEKVFFIKYEFWFHFLQALKQNAIPHYLASGNFRSSQLFFKWYGGWYRNFLCFFSHIFVQNESSNLLLHSIGIQNASVAGDTRFDRVMKIRHKAAVIESLKVFSEEKPVVIAGSTWEKDEKLLHEVYRQMKGSCHWIIAPHEPSHKNILRLKEQFKSSLLFTEIEENSEIKTDVVLVDTIGQLSSLYQYGTFAYIGGGFGKGIHNILEAATFGLPLMFGPNFQSFEEAKDLLSAGAAYVVQQPEEGIALIQSVIESEELRKSIRECTENYIINKLGATQKIVDFVFIKAG